MKILRVMDKGKEVTLYILEQYRDHCQTTDNMGEDADKENLKEVKEAIKWVRAQQCYVFYTLLPLTQWRFNEW